MARFSNRSDVERKKKKEVRVDSKAFGWKNWVNEYIYIVILDHIKENWKFKMFKKHIVCKQFGVSTYIKVGVPITYWL